MPMRARPQARRDDLLAADAVKRWDDLASDDAPRHDTHGALIRLGAGIAIAAALAGIWDLLK